MQAYGYFAMVVFMTISLYAYIYHLYSKRKDVDGRDYEEYSNLALHDDISDTLVNDISKDDEK